MWCADVSKTGSALNLLKQFDFFSGASLLISSDSSSEGGSLENSFFFPAQSKKKNPPGILAKQGGGCTDHFEKDLKNGGLCRWESSKAGDSSFLKEQRVQLGGKTYSCWDG